MSVALSTRADEGAIDDPRSTAANAKLRSKMHQDLVVS
jgi:hypothetical protein